MPILSNSIFQLKTPDRNPIWLLIGIGGGGDIYGCLPMKWELETLGFEVRLGSLTWERSLVDPRPGPRSLKEMKGIEPFSTYGAIGGPETMIDDGTYFQGSILARKANLESVLFVDISGGVKGVIDTLEEYVSKENITGIIGLDVGGDVIASGSEPGLHSPLADATLLAAIGQLSPDVIENRIIGIFGMNADGELTQQELLARMSGLTGAYIGAIGHGPKSFREIENVLADPACVTEASRQPLKALGGYVGKEKIREGEREVEINLLLTITFLFDASLLLPYCPIANLIRNTTSIIEADALIREKMQIPTEYSK